MRFRKWSVFVTLLVIIAALLLPVQASEYRFVYDEAMLMTTSKAAELEDLAADISLRYGCGVYIVTVWDYTEYGNSVRSAAENIFLANDFGLGSDDNGVLLLLSMADRDYALIAHGETGNRTFTDYGKDVLSEEFLDDFRYDSWAAGFEDYLRVSEEFLSAAAKGTPVDVAVSGADDVPPAWIMILLFPALIAGVSCGIMAASMKSARQKTDVNDYRQAAQIQGRSDRFITRTVVRQKIETSSSSSSGGTSVNSGGFSGKSGKF